MCQADRSVLQKTKMVLQVYQNLKRKKLGEKKEKVSNRDGQSRMVGTELETGVLLFRWFWESYSLDCTV